MKRWGWPEDGVSPYRATLFQILDLDPAEQNRATIRYRITRRRNRIRSAPDRHLLDGRPLTEADVNRAEAALADPVARRYAELCTPARERAWTTTLPEPPHPLAVLDLAAERLAAFLHGPPAYVPPPPPDWWKEHDDRTT